MEVIALLLLVLVGVGLSLLKTPSVKGQLGEKKVQIVTSLLLDRNQYRRIDNVTIPVRDGTTQIDHVIVSIYGIFVIETKNIKGWIFGGSHQREWTQVLYRKSYKFQNPLRQNFFHVKSLQDALGIPSTSIRSVIVFAGDVQFKSEMPDNVIYAAKLPAYIRSFKQPVFTEDECQSLSDRIQSARLPATRVTQRDHVKALKGRFSGASESICPRCGGNLIVRTAKKGPSAGSQFLGCSGYPRCKYTRAVT